MKFSTLLPLTYLNTLTLAQTFSLYTDTNNITFWQNTWSTTLSPSPAQFGLALPPADFSLSPNEYIGRLICPIPATSSGTWLGLTHTSGMTGSLILLIWLNGEEVMSSFRYASGYVEPEIYTGNASLSVIERVVNETHFGLTYRCENCWSWEQDGVAGSQVPSTTTNAAQLLGWAQATEAPSPAEDPAAGIVQHANAGIMAATVLSARNSAYTDWISLATATTAAASATGTGSVGAGSNAAATATSASTEAACTSTSTVMAQTWDYIVVGAGAGGIPVADKLSESGASVLLIEKGPPSSGRWGGTIKPDWLADTNLTRFDVPGLDNEIWVDSDGIACTDVGVMAGCVLGGGTAVNAGLWWKANPTDFDYNFPEGWKSTDMEPAIERVFERIPYTACPSMDGKIYQPEGYEVVAGALAASGWKNVTADESPAEKNFTFSRPNHMFSNGERGGPMATYLVSASERDNFQLITDTSVARVVRNGSLVTGVEVEGSVCGTINANNVVLSAGAFGTAKILFRSGIGPSDQLEVVSGAEGDSMIDSTQWINLPVGHNLDDHASTDIVLTHPNVTTYDFYAAYDEPIIADKDLYINSRSGILAQSAPNLIANFWQEVEGADGIIRQLQYSARVEGSHDIESENAVSISQYLGRGSTGRGRTTITAALDMVVSEIPYIQGEEDLAAVKTGIEALIAALGADPSIEVVYPAANTTIDEYLANYPLTTSSRTANHWMGTAKMGLDSGLENNGTAVVDTNTKVYGTDNLFVVDASVFPGMVTTNPSALIVSVAEHASEKILALGSDSNNNNNTNNDTVSSSSPATVSSTTVTATGSTSDTATSVTVSSTTNAVPTRSSVAAGENQQCGGVGFSGASVCEDGLTCKQWNPYYYQCVAVA